MKETRLKPLILYSRQKHHPCDGTHSGGLGRADTAAGLTSIHPSVNVSVQLLHPPESFLQPWGPFWVAPLNFGHTHRGQLPGCIVSPSLVSGLFRLSVNCVDANRNETS